jgi:hypothetical protein
MVKSDVGINKGRRGKIICEKATGKKMYGGCTDNPPGIVNIQGMDTRWR